MRLFIAIQVPDQLHEYCRELQTHFPEIKETEAFHMTLQFLGSDIESAERITEALKQVRFRPFEIEMGDAIPFGPPKHPRGSWIECKETKDLVELADQIRIAMETLGFLSDKPFRAHITLGRYKKTPKVTPKKTSGSRKVYEVSSFELIQSHLSETGPKYKIVATFEAKDK